MEEKNKVKLTESWTIIKLRSYKSGEIKLDEEKNA